MNVADAEHAASEPPIDGPCCVTARRTASSAHTEPLREANITATMVSHYHAVHPIAWRRVRRGAPKGGRPRTEDGMGGVHPRSDRMPPTQVQIHRFWTKVDRAGPQRSDLDEPCWIWRGGVDKKGYGKVAYKSGDGAKHWVASHRFVAMISDMDATLCVLHRCDNPPCCNPSHLYSGTIADNLRDMREKGRHLTGAAASDAYAKVGTPELVRAVRTSREDGLSFREIAAIHGISEGYVSGIINGARRAHVI